MALLARLEEPDPVVARAGGRDSAITGDDRVAIYLATSGSAWLENEGSPQIQHRAEPLGPHLPSSRPFTTTAYGRWRPEAVWLDI